MTNKILVIVHLEPDFGSAAEDLVPLVLREIENGDYAKVINITSAESLTGTEPFPEMIGVGEDMEWIWGFDADEYLKQEPERWVEGKNFLRTNGHEYSEILDWMHEVPKSAEYAIVGGGRDECLQDIVDIWDHLMLHNEVKEELTY